MTFATQIARTQHVAGIPWRLGLRAFKSASFRRYLVVGTASRGVQTLVLFVATDLAGVHYLVSSLIAVSVVVVGGFLVNKFWTFNAGGQRETLPTAPTGHFWWLARQTRGESWLTMDYRLEKTKQ